MESGLAYTFEHLVGRGEARHRRRQVGVGTFHSGDQSADGGQHAFEINAVALSHQAAGLAKIQNSKFSSGTQDAHDFLQAGIVVGQIAKAER